MSLRALCLVLAVIPFTAARAQTAALKAEMDRLDGQSGEMKNSSRTAWFVYRPALSYHAPKMGDVAKSRLVSVTTFRVKPGRIPDWNDYVYKGQWEKALSVYDRLLILDSSAAAHFRDRGAVLVRLGQLQKGASDWERYLTRCPKAEDTDTVRQRLRQVRQRLAALN